MRQKQPGDRVRESIEVVSNDRFFGFLLRPTGTGYTGVPESQEIQEVLATGEEGFIYYYFDP